MRWCTRSRVADIGLAADEAGLRGGVRGAEPLRRSGAGRQRPAVVRDRIEQCRLGALWGSRAGLRVVACGCSLDVECRSRCWTGRCGVAAARCGEVIEGVSVRAVGHAGAAVKALALLAVVSVVLLLWLLGSQWDVSIHGRRCSVWFTAWRVWATSTVRRCSRTVGEGWSWRSRGVADGASRASSAGRLARADGAGLGVHGRGSVSRCCSARWRCAVRWASLQPRWRGRPR